MIVTYEKRTPEERYEIPARVWYRLMLRNPDLIGDDRWRPFRAELVPGQGVHSVSASAEFEPYEERRKPSEHIRLRRRLYPLARWAVRHTRADLRRILDTPPDAITLGVFVNGEIRTINSFSNLPPWAVTLVINDLLHLKCTDAIALGLYAPTGGNLRSARMIATRVGA